MTSSGSKNRLGVQGGSQARSIAARGILAHATFMRYARPTLFAQTGSGFYSPECLGEILRSAHVQSSRKFRARPACGPALSCR
jgi:hypothetical protein